MRKTGPSNTWTYTKKDRRLLGPLVTYQDARNKVREDKAFMDSIADLPKAERIEKFNLESLKVANIIGVNLETVQSKRNAGGCCQKQNASQRMDMSQSQQQTMVLPIKNAEPPFIDSSMAADVYTRSSCIKRPEGKTVKVLGVIRYQFRKIIIYEDNGKFDYLDTNGTIECNGFGCKENTDLLQLPIGEEVDVSQDNFLIKYPDQYNPTTDIVGYGYNPRTIVATNWHNSGDSALVSESFVRHFTTIKCKTVNVHLNNKSIKSSYPGKFPQIGEFIKNTIVFKICNDIGIVSELSQSTKMATGAEDDTIVMHKNSYLTSVEVYCNNPIKDPDLEKYRLELLDFRRKVYDIVAPLVDNFYDRCSYQLRILKENFSHEAFNVNGQELKYPYVRMKFNTIDVPTIGQKFSKCWTFIQ